MRAQYPLARYHCRRLDPDLAPKDRHSENEPPERSRNLDLNDVTAVAHTAADDQGGKCHGQARAATCESEVLAQG